MPATKKQATKKTPAQEGGQEPKAMVKAVERSVAPLAKSMEDLHIISQAVFKSGYFPDIKSAAQAFLRMKVGMELGLPEMASLRSVHYLEKSRDFVIMTRVLGAIAMNQGIRWKEIEKSKTACRLEIFKPGSNIPPVKVSFTKEDAERAKLWHKNNFLAYPEEMLYWRCLSKGLRQFDPRIDMGYYTKEELEDVTPFQEESEDVADTEVVEGEEEMHEEDEGIDEAEVADEEEKQTREPGEDDDIEDRQPEGDANIEKRTKIFEYQIKVIQQDCDIYGKGIYQDFKQYLYEKQTTKRFVEKNERQQLSLHCGKIDDIDFLYEKRMEFYRMYFNDRQKLAMAGKPVVPAALRYFQKKEEE